VSVKVENLVKTYGGQNAVDHISFEARRGEILGLLGPNGAGKSTTMKIITGFIPPTSGKVEVDGYNVVSDPLKVKYHIGYLPEQNPLYLDMYVHEYLCFGGSIYGLSAQGLKMRVKEAIDLIGLGLEQNKKVGQLSRGYRQRVGLAHALLHDPSVLILDEATTGLDPNQILEIRRLIKDISKEKTVIFSSHIMQEVQALCTKVVILNRGKMVAYDNVEKVAEARKEYVQILAEFKKEPDLTLFENIPGLVVAEKLSGQKYRFKCHANTDIREELFEIASANGLPIIGMEMEKNTLEQAFKDLTKE